jgi:hypothetical protein
MPQRQALHSDGVIISSLNPSMASLGLGVQFEAAESRDCSLHHYALRIGINNFLP